MEHDRPVLLLDRERRPPDGLAVLRLHARRSRAGRPCASSPPTSKYGHMLSADGRIDYSARLGEITTPTLMVAGEGDIMSDVPSTELTFQALGSPDKTLMTLRQVERPRRRLRPLRPGLEPLRPRGDLPAADRLARPPPAGRPCDPAASAAARSIRVPSPSPQEGIDADLRPGLELVP